MARRMAFGPNKLHPLHKHDLDIAVSHGGSAAPAVTFIADDLWSAILAPWHLFDHCGYVPAAVRARRRDRATSS